MLETREQETLPFEEDTQPPEEITKYHKRIDDLLEDAEIEAEMEAEKKIRSKNSRMFSISMVGIALLGLVYFQVNQQSTEAPIETAKNITESKPETAEERLAKQVPVVEGGSNTIPIPQSISSNKKLENPFLTPPKTKNSAPKTKSTTPKIKSTTPKSKEVKKAPRIVKASTSPKPKSSPKKTAPVTKIESSKFYIQAGAFGVQKNAETLLKQLKGKGFSPSIQTRTKKANQHIVTVGSFTNKKAGKDTLKELTSKGFNASYYKKSNNNLTLKVGQYRNFKDAQKTQDRLSIKGFLSESHKANVPVKTYMVQLGVFPNREKARLTPEKLARAGFPKTFIR